MKEASAFATVEEIQSTKFRSIARKLAQIHIRLELLEHGELNAQQFSWAQSEHPSEFSMRRG